MVWMLRAPCCSESWQLILNEWYRAPRKLQLIMGWMLWAPCCFESWQLILNEWYNDIGLHNNHAFVINSLYDWTTTCNKYDSSWLEVIANTYIYSKACSDGLDLVYLVYFHVYVNNMLSATIFIVGVWCHNSCILDVYNILFQVFLHCVVAINFRTKTIIFSYYRNISCLIRVIPFIMQMTKHRRISHYMVKKNCSFHTVRKVIIFWK